MRRTQEGVKLKLAKKEGLVYNAEPVAPLRTESFGLFLRQHVTLCQQMAGEAHLCADGWGVDRIAPLFSRAVRTQGQGDTMFCGSLEVLFHAGVPP